MSSSTGTALRLDAVELEIVYLRDGRRVTVPAGEDLLDEARRIGAEVAEAVRAGRFEAQPERRRCSLCAYQLSCDAALWRALVPAPASRSHRPWRRPTAAG